MLIFFETGLWRSTVLQPEPFSADRPALSYRITQGKQPILKPIVERDPTSGILRDSSKSRRNLWEITVFKVLYG